MISMPSVVQAFLHKMDTNKISIIFSIMEMNHPLPSIPRDGLVHSSVYLHIDPSLSPLPATRGPPKCKAILFLLGFKPRRKRSSAAGGVSPAGTHPKGQSLTSFDSCSPLLQLL
jgi:hypothetical protein